MIDWFVVLTPLLLLPIFLLFVFVGCQFQVAGTGRFGQPGDIPVPGAYFGQGVARAAVFRPGDGTWHTIHEDIFTASTLSEEVTSFGKSGDQPIPGDYDGSGPLQPNAQFKRAVFRPADQTWHIGNEATFFNLPPIIHFTAGDIPLPPGDYLGNGKRDVALFQPSSRRWWILDQTGNVLQPSPITFPQQAPASLGEDIPVPGDYLGNGRTQLAVFRPSSMEWFTLDLFSGTPHNFNVVVADKRFGFDRGLGDVPLPPRLYELVANNRGVAIYRPQEKPGIAFATTAVYYIIDLNGNLLPNGRIEVITPSTAGDVAVPAGYDFPQIAEEAIFRGAQGKWARPEGTVLTSGL